MISDAALEALSPSERAELVHRLHTITGAESTFDRRILMARRWFPRVLAGCCLFLVPWIFGLAVTLPRVYVSGHWRAQWIGFDVMLLVGLGLTGWGLAKRRQIAIPAGFITGALLLCDAWFDIMSSDGRKSFRISLASAVLAEIPLGILLILIGARLLRETVRVAHGLPLEAAIPALRHTPLLTWADLAEVD